MNQLDPRSYEVLYEVLFLASPDITTDEEVALESQLEKMAHDNKSGFVSNDRWGKYKLAYPVRKNDYGVYYLARFGTTGEHVNNLLKDINNFFTIKNTDIVMRHMVCRLDPNRSLEYQRPQSVEDAPDREGESLLKDKKMDYSLSKDSDMSENEDHGI
jgi:small subunit ribosomal protein S6